MRQTKSLLAPTFALALVATILFSPASANAAQTRPNLRVNAVTATPASVVAGAPITATVTVRNSGRRNARRSRTSFWLSADARVGESDVKLGSASTASMAKGKRRNVRLAAALPLGISPGAYRLIACADAGRWLRESRERDNCASAALQVQAQAAFAPEPAPVEPDTDGDGILDKADDCPNDADPCAVSVYEIRDGTIAPGTKVELRGLMISGVAADWATAQLDNNASGYSGADFSGIKLDTSGVTHDLDAGDCVRVEGVVGASSYELALSLVEESGAACTVPWSTMTLTKVLNKAEENRFLLTAIQATAAEAGGGGYEMKIYGSLTTIFISPEFIGTPPAIDEGSYTITGVFKPDAPYPVFIPRTAEDFWDDSIPPG